MYLHEKQTSRIQSLNICMHYFFVFFRQRPAQARENLNISFLYDFSYFAQRFNNIALVYNIYNFCMGMTLAVSRAFMVGLDKQPVDMPDSSQASGLASRFQESMNVHRGTGVSTAVTLHLFCILRFTLVNNIITQNLVYTKIHLQLNCYHKQYTECNRK